MTSVAPAVAQDQDGRLEVHLRIGEQLWHSWQKVTGGPDWVPGASLGQPDDQASVGLPVVALDVDGRLPVFAPSGPHIWVRGADGTTGAPGAADAALPSGYCP